jgi:hypothetical protein
LSISERLDGRVRSLVVAIEVIEAGQATLPGLAR